MTATAPSRQSGANRSLLEAFLAERSEASFRSLYRRYTPRLWALALRLGGGDRPRAEDLIQEAWVRAIERLEQFEGRSAFGTWLSGILVNCYREHWKSISNQPASLDDPDFELPQPPDTQVGDAWRAAGSIDLERALARLAPGYRTVVVLFDINGLSHREISEHLAIDEGTSKSQLARGRARLRELLTLTLPIQPGPEP